MGNDQQKPQSRRSLPALLPPFSKPLKITRRNTQHESRYDILSYEYTETSLPKLESLQNRWQAVQELPTDRVCKPFHIQIADDSRLFAKSFRLSVLFEAYDVSLASFVRDLNRTSPLVPEVFLVSVLADCAEALLALCAEAIRHENVSPDSIFHISRDHWALTMPSLGRETLQTRIAAGGTHLVFLVAPEIGDGQVHDSFLADVFSLGVAVLHCAFKFTLPETQRRLRQADLDTKLRFMAPYYSADFVKLLSMMTQESAEMRINSSQVVQYLRELRDL